MSAEKLRSLVERKLKTRLNLSIDELDEHDRKSCLMEIKKFNSGLSDIEETAKEIADEITDSMYRDWVDQTLLDRIGHALNDFPNPNDEIMDYFMCSDLDWDNIDQYTCDQIKADAEQTAEAWIIGCWDEESKSFK